MRWRSIFSKNLSKMSDDDRMVTVETPGKINLALRVLDRRDDGYHQLDTIFQAVDLSDRLTLKRSDGLHFHCDIAAISDDSNLVIRAAALLARTYDCPCAASISLEKRLPIAGGMGGGSANAAGALIGLSKLWELDAPTASLVRLAAELGADVPFFLTGGTARGRERGDRIESMRYFGDAALLLAVPSFGIATAEVFAKGSEDWRLPTENLHFPGNLGAQEDLSWMQNDLEEAAFAIAPSLRTMRDAIERLGASRSMLSGSGSTVFGLFPDGGSRDAAIKALCEEFADWRLLAANTTASGVRIIPAAETGEGD